MSIRAFALNINCQSHALVKDAASLYLQDVLSPAWVPKAAVFSIWKCSVLNS